MSTTLKTLIAGGFVAALVGCSAAPAPCLVSRPLTGGYAVELRRNGAAPAGCTDVPITRFHVDPDNGFTVAPPLTGPSSPQVWFDGWRTDLFKPTAVITDPSVLAIHSDLMSFPADNSTIVQAPWPSNPDANNLCTVNDIAAMTDQVDPLQIGGGQTTLSYKIKKITFLDGTLYAGLQFTADVDVTFGTCTASYTAYGLSPSVYEGFLYTGNSCTQTEPDCSPNADPTHGRSLGTGYNPLFKVECRTDLGAAFVNSDGTGVCFLPSTGTFPFVTQ